MGKQNNQMAFYALIFFQGLVSFILGIAGNKISDVTNIPVGVLVIGTILLIGVSFGVSILLLKSEASKESLSSSAEPKTKEGLIGSILSRVITSFPFGIFIGLISTAFFIYVIWFPSISFILSQENKHRFYLYELVSWIVLLISVYLINQRKQDRAIVLAYGLGFAIGASSSIMALDFQYNDPVMTFLGWLFVSFITALAAKSSTIKGIMNDINEMTTNITTKR